MHYLSVAVQSLSIESVASMHQERTLFRAIKQGLSFFYIHWEFTQEARKLLAHVY